MLRACISEPTERESKSTTVMQRQEGSFISSALGPKSHPAQQNPTRAPSKGVWRLIYRQFFVSVTGVAGVTWLARQDERMSCLFLVNMTQVLEPLVWSLTHALYEVNITRVETTQSNFFLITYSMPNAGLRQGQKNAPLISSTSALYECSPPSAALTKIRHMALMGSVESHGGLCHLCIWYPWLQADTTSQ